MQVKKDITSENILRIFLHFVRLIKNNININRFFVVFFLNELHFRTELNLSFSYRNKYSILKTNLNELTNNCTT